MQRFALILAGFVFAAGSIVGAKEKDTVYFRQPGKKQDEPIAGTIQEESPAGIKIKPDKGAVKEIPVQQIRAVEYGAGLDAVGKLDYRSGDTKLERALLETPEKKKSDLEMALSAFRTLDSNDQLSRISPVHRYLQYRIAQTMALLAREDARRRDAAVSALSDYKTAFSDGWEIVPALQLLASLQEDKGETEAASKTYSELSDLPGISATMKFESQLKGARLLMRILKFREAEAKLKLVEAAMPANDPQRAIVDVYLIQSLIAQKRTLDGIAPKLQKIIRTGKDGNLRGLAHNALGDYYRAKGDDAQAFWEYCKVDMLYNQDKEEHAKALYYLSQLYDKSPRNNPARADEVLARLKSPQFDGTMYQRLTASEKK
jgi:hypothetical protein